MTVYYAAYIAIAYLIGSVPFGIIIGSKLYGIDIRGKGSGNIGATNAFRVLGPKAGTTVLFADIFKGFFAVKFVQLMVGAGSGAASGGPLPALELLAAVAVVLGHTTSPFLGFSGGKGVATAAGAIGAMMPLTLFALVSIWIFTVVLTKYVSVASMLAATLFPVMVFLTGQNPYRKALSVFIFLAIIITHKSNIKRLAKGEENKFTMRAK